MDIQVLRDLLVDKLTNTPVQTKHGRGCITLKESGADAKLKKVDLYDVSEDSLVIKLDRADPPKSLFKSDKGVRRRCDYVVITRMSDVYFMIFIEMKSKRQPRKEIEEKFLGSECIVDYCDATLRRFFSEDAYFRKVKRRFVLFYKPPLAKRRTRPSKASLRNDTVARVLKYASPVNPSVKELIGK